LQGLARAKSILQPDRFLVINIQGSRPCEQLFQAIKTRVLGTVDDFDFSADEVADVIKYGICGPSDRTKPIELRKTRNLSRVSIDSKVAAIEKESNFPILVIDEFNPTDFTWPQGADYALPELEDKMGDAFKFFNARTGVAQTDNGFVVFVGTKSEAVARALHKINGGTKSALARCTTGEPESGYPFKDWEGFQWSAKDKAKVVRELYGEKYKKVLRDKDLPNDEVEIGTETIILDLCSQDENIRRCCLDMEEKLLFEKGENAALLQSRSQTSPTAGGCFADWKDAKANAEACTIS
jgi:hypothetical protein